MTPEQTALLRPVVQAEASLAEARRTGDDGAIARWLNAPASPAFIVWKTRVTREVVLGSGFDFTQVDNLTVGQARIFDWLFESGVMNPSLPSRHTAILEAWKGTPAKVAVGTYVLSQCKRSATRAEKVLANGTGSDAVPATMTWESQVTADECSSLR